MWSCCVERVDSGIDGNSIDSSGGALSAGRAFIHRAGCSGGTERLPGETIVVNPASLVAVEGGGDLVILCGILGSHVGRELAARARVGVWLV